MEFVLQTATGRYYNMSPSLFWTLWSTIKKKADMHIKTNIAEGEGIPRVLDFKRSIGLVTLGSFSLVLRHAFGFQEPTNPLLWRIPVTCC